MKTKIFAALSAAALVILMLGCVKTVGGGSTPGVPFADDKINASYERPMDEVFQAAKDVVKFNGTLVHESIQYGQTNVVGNIAKVVMGKVNQRSVWVKITQINPTISAVTVQTRTSGGMPDKDLAASIDKQIALKLVR